MTANSGYHPVRVIHALITRVSVLTVIIVRMQLLLLRHFNALLALDLLHNASVSIKGIDPVGEEGKLEASTKTSERQSKETLVER